MNFLSMVHTKKKNPLQNGKKIVDGCKSVIIYVEERKMKEEILFERYCCI